MSLGWATPAPGKSRRENAKRTSSLFMILPPRSQLGVWLT
jgi:hypothetical protein